MAAQETKMILAKSLVGLLEEQPIEKITIQEIVDRSGYNRQTFYYHFTDIFDLLGWILHRDYDMLFEDHVFSAEDPMPVKISKVFDLLLERKTVILHSYNPNGRYYYEKMMRPWISTQLKKMIEDSPLANQISAEEVRFIIDSFTWVFSGLFFDWLEQGMPKQSESIIENYYLLIQVSVDSSIKAFAKRRKGSRK